ncbi:MAG: hypothetical protein NPIRA06_32420 [Nitrospirales bacterium]|nr:MAG: hypothetical protein NPIRA06_32420 [Nitrospirales bacterium]
MQLKFLLIVTAILEAGTGLTLVLLPSMPVVIPVAALLVFYWVFVRNRTLLPWMAACRDAQSQA